MAVAPEVDNKPWRLFVAVELPDSLLAALQESLGGLESLRDWFRTSPIEQIHLTLHFLGGVDSGAVPKLVDALAPAVGGHQAFDLTVRGVDAFGGTRRPRVLWAGFTGAGLDRLRALREDTGHALEAMRIEIDADFRPHLTLGRARRPLDSTGRRALRAWYDRWKAREFGMLPVRTVHLMRSQLGRGPAQHSSIARFELE